MAVKKKFMVVSLPRNKKNIPCFYAVSVSVAYYIPTPRKKIDRKIRIQRNKPYQKLGSTP